MIIPIHLPEVPDLTRTFSLVMTLDHRIPESPVQFLRSLARERNWWKFTAVDVEKFTSGELCVLQFKGTHLIPRGGISIRQNGAETDSMKWCGVLEAPGGPKKSELAPLALFFITDISSFGGLGVQWGKPRYSGKSATKEESSPE